MGLRNYGTWTPLSETYQVSRDKELVYLHRKDKKHTQVVVFFKDKYINHNIIVTFFFIFFRSNTFSPFAYTALNRVSYSFIDLLPTNYYFRSIVWTERPVVKQ